MRSKITIKALFLTVDKDTWGMKYCSLYILYVLHITYFCYLFDLAFYVIFDIIPFRQSLNAGYSSL